MPLEYWRNIWHRVPQVSFSTVVEERSRMLGATRAVAMVLDDNPWAHAFWRDAGYARQAEWSRWVKPLDSHSGRQ